MEKKKCIIENFEKFLSELNIQKYDADFVSEVLTICKKHTKIKQELMEFFIRENITSLNYYEDETLAIKTQQKIVKEYFKIAEKYNIYEKGEGKTFHLF